LSIFGAEKTLQQLCKLNKKTGQVDQMVFADPLHVNRLYKIFKISLKEAAYTEKRIHCNLKVVIRRIDNIHSFESFKKSYNDKCTNELERNIPILSSCLINEAHRNPGDLEKCMCQAK
jgi:hypothetical protein